MADITTTRIFTDGERGITAQKLNDIVGSSVIQPAFYTSKPTAGSADPADIALILKAGAYAQVPISTLAGSATQAQIWSTRLRSFNSVGNPNFEVAQRNVGNLLTNPVAGTFIEDRWQKNGSGTYAVNAQALSVGLPDVCLPGTNFRVSNRFIRFTLTTAQATLGASDHLSLYQFIEGPYYRELSYDVHSLSLLVRSSVANLNFSVTLKDTPTSTRTLSKLCNIPTANTWTLIQLPNLPVFSSTGNFSSAAGNNAYVLVIALACGSTLVSPAADTWQNGNFNGAPGMNNFVASPVNSTFDIAFVQHEPGAVCSTFIDKPFVQNYDECLRYYHKTYTNATIPGSVASSGQLSFPMISNTSFGTGNYLYPKPMAKTPTWTAYNSATGAINSCRLWNGGVDLVVGSVGGNEKGITSVQLGTPQTVPAIVQCQVVSDTGW